MLLQNTLEGRMGFEPTSLPPVPSGAHPHVLPARVARLDTGLFSTFNPVQLVRAKEIHASDIQIRWPYHTLTSTGFLYSAIVLDLH